MDSRNNDITPDMARQELARRELARRAAMQGSMQNPIQDKLGQLNGPINNFLDNLKAGMFQGLKDTGGQVLDLASAAQPMPQLAQAGYQNAIDPYKLAGVQEQSINTPAGIEQAIGQYGPMVAGIGKLGLDLGKLGAGKIADKLAKLKEPPASTADEATKEVLQNLGQGAENKEQAAKKLADMMREGHSQNADQSQPFFKHTFQQAGEEKLYEHVDPLISTALDKAKSMLNRLEHLNVGGLYEKFKKSPTIENAHNLQSELGSAVRELEEKTGKTADELYQLAGLRDVRNTLKTDIIDSLKRHDLKSNDNLAPTYQRGIDLHRENVEPYRSTSKLREITQGGVETPKNIENIFNTPTNVINPRTGEVSTGAIHKILQDLPEEAKDLVLFNKIGAMRHEGNSKALVKALEKARNEGYSHYFTPRVNESIKDLLEKTKHDELMEAMHKVGLEKLANKKKIAEWIGAGVAGGTAAGAAPTLYNLLKPNTSGLQY